MKQPVLSDVGNILSATIALNDNWDAIQGAFNNTLSRDGSAPNEMGADIDLNGNDLLNVKNLDLTGILTVGGADITDKFAQASADAASAAQDADDAGAFANQAETFGNPIFNTIPIMAAYGGAVDGQTVSVYSGFNDEREEFDYVAGGTLIADGALVVDGVGGQWVSKRTVYADFAEFIGDRRTFAAETKLAIPSIGAMYQATDVTGNLGQTNAGGQGFDVLTVDGKYWAEHFGAIDGGSAATNYAAAQALWAAALADGVDMSYGPGTFDIGDNNYPFRQSDASGGLLDCGGISLIATPATTFSTTSTDGADVFQLNGLDNFNIVGYPNVTATLTDTIGSGSNGVSITNGFDRLYVEVNCLNLPSIDKTSFIDGGKALTFQPSTTSNKCGSAKVFVRAKGCSYAFGCDLVLTNVAANAMEIDAHVIAEDCYAHHVISAGAATAAITNATNMGVRIRGSSINCQRDSVLSRAHGVDVDIDLNSTKTAAAKRLDPNGVAWWASTTTVDTLLCTYAHNSKVVIRGDKGACDYKAQIGGSTAGSSGLIGATNSCDITLDIGGTAATSDINAVNSGGNYMRDTTLTVSARTGAIPAILKTPSYKNYFPNTLYEYGSFTPILTDSNLVAEGATYSVANGKYIRVGNLVTFEIYMTVTGLGTLTVSEGAFIIGLPYTSSTTLVWGAVNLAFASNLNLSAAATVSGRILQNTSRVQLQKWSATETAGHASMLVSEVSADGTLALTGSYYTDEA